MSYYTCSDRCRIVTSFFFVQISFNFLSTRTSCCFFLNWLLRNFIFVQQYLRLSLSVFFLLFTTLIFDWDFISLFNCTTYTIRWFRALFLWMSLHQAVEQQNIEQIKNFIQSGKFCFFVSLLLLNFTLIKIILLSSHIQLFLFHIDCFIRWFLSLWWS